MPLEKTDALVLRIVDFSESSCVVTLLTPDFGKIGAMAKGARRLKSPFDGAIDLLSFCKIVFISKNNDTLDLLTESKLQRRFKSASKDLKRLYCGYYVAELILTMTDEGEPNRALFELAKETLEYLDAPEPRTGIELSKAILQFELRVMNLLGNLPSFTHCVDCGASREEKAQLPNPSSVRRFFFGLRNGGLLCQQCRRTKKSVISLSQTGLENLIKFADPNNDWQRIACDDAVVGEISSVVRRYVSHLLGFQPKLQSYIEKLA